MKKKYEEVKKVRQRPSLSFENRENVVKARKEDASLTHIAYVYLFDGTILAKALWMCEIR